MSYNPWPLGKVPKEFQRPELEQVKKLGYKWEDARDVVDMFEKEVAKLASSKYAVAVDCCTHGIFLSLVYLMWKGDIKKNAEVTIPRRTYISVPMQIMHAGLKVRFDDRKWSGIYQLKGTNVWDGAVRWTRNMYQGNGALQVLSCQLKKRIPIGKGGLILTDSLDAYKHLKLMSYDGRDLNTPYDDPYHVKSIGYHMYMTPEDAARGLMLMHHTPDQNPDTASWESYPDVEKMLMNI